MKTFGSPLVHNQEAFLLLAGSYLGFFQIAFPDFFHIGIIALFFNHIAHCVVMYLPITIITMQIESMKQFYFPCIFIFFISFSSYQQIHAQSFWFGPKIGPGLNFQFWDQYNRQALIAPNFSFFIETYSEDKPSSFYAQVGYHSRGSSILTANIFSGINSQQAVRFNNAVLELGGKKLLSMDKKFNPYYLLGLRLEYNVNNNLESFDRFQSFFYPNEQFIEKFVYGVSFGGGFNTRISDLIGADIEFVFTPDFSFQYIQPMIPNVRDPFSGQNITLREQSIRNYGLEIRFVMRFLRQVIYVD